MDLFHLAQAGNEEALNQLVCAHMPLVQALSRRFSYCEDAFQQGCVGLVKAIRRFRPETGNQFSTYAVPVILGEMKKAFHNGLGWRARASIRKAREYQELCLRNTGCLPPVSQTAHAAGLPPEELALLLEMDKGPVYDETGDMLASLPDPDGDKWLLRFCVRDVLERLPREESEVLLCRYILGRTQSELALIWHIPQYQVSRKEKRARQHFRTAWDE